MGQGNVMHECTKCRLQIIPTFNQVQVVQEYSPYLVNAVELGVSSLRGIIPEKMMVSPNIKSPPSNSVTIGSRGLISVSLGPI
jgi:hypothetical protein